jgi:type II secretory ATPase GspE/PulE/Tfp pilus assembly ATPase PilB-like protein
MTFYHGGNSPACKKSGYQGRVGLFELMEMTDTVRGLVVTKASRRSQGGAGS